MCLDRRAFLAGGAALTATVAAGTPASAGRAAAAAPVQLAPVPVEVAPGLTVLRRDSWGADLAAPSDLPAEAPGDVRVLLVHHSATTNDYDEAGAIDEIRTFHALHTGPDKDWPDVAYNFFVDRFGRVWEGRAGSLDRPVIGDATGGNQGFSQLVCLIGNFVADEPTPEAIDSLVRVLAWLGQRDRVDLTPGATTSFESRGSNRWREGATVETTTIAGHRDMSVTACPGDVAYARVRGDLPTLVADRAAAVAAATAPQTPPPTTAAPATAPPPADTTVPPTTSATSGTASSEAAAARRSGDDGTPTALVGGVAATAVAAAAAVALRLRTRRD